MDNINYKTKVITIGNSIGVTIPKWSMQYEDEKIGTDDIVEVSIRVVKKGLKEEPVSQQEMGLCLRLGEQSDVTTEFSDWLKKKITILQDGRLEVDLRDLR
jgi:hypothetical protein